MQIEDHVGRSLPFFYYSFKSTDNESAEAALVSGAGKKQTYLKQLGRQLLPFKRAKRGGFH